MSSLLAGVFFFYEQAPELSHIGQPIEAHDTKIHAQTGVCDFLANLPTDAAVDGCKTLNATLCGQRT